MYGPNYLNYGYGMYDQHPLWRMSYPDVDAQHFQQAAQSFKGLMTDAVLLTDALADHTNLAHDMMTSAQENNMKRVEELVQSTGVKGKVHVRYNPDGIHFEMRSDVAGVDCCKLDMIIKWR